MGYANKQIIFVLQNYIDISSGAFPVDKAKEYLRSAGNKNPGETFIIWKSDIDQAISSLCPKNDMWCLLCHQVIGEKIRFHIGRLPRMQRVIVSAYILDDWMDWNGLSYGDREVGGIITRMRKFLNGDGRDEKGRFMKAGEANGQPMAV